MLRCVDSLVCAPKVCAAVCLSCHYDTATDFRKVVVEARSQFGKIKKAFVRNGFAAPQPPASRITL